MDWIQGIQRAIDYVEEHITDEIDFEETAGVCLPSGDFLSVLRKTLNPYRY